MINIPQSYLQNAKVAAHCIQTLLVFIAACLSIAVLSEDGSQDSGTDWLFALVSYASSIDSHLSIAHKLITIIVLPHHASSNLPSRSADMDTSLAISARLCLRRA